MLLMRMLGRVGVRGVAVLGLWMPLAPAAYAQGGPNTGNISFSSGIDFLPGSAYIFRGIVQESDPKLTLWPSGEVGFAVYSGDGGVQSFDVSFGVWHSLHTGSSGSEVEGQGMHYEEDFYAGFSLDFAGDTSLGVAYTAYTSPNGLFGTIHEISFSFAMDNMVAPYVTIAQELDGGADGGSSEGTYLELGVEPSWDLANGQVSVSIPVKIGLSLSDYYELQVARGQYEDNKFGYLDVGIAFSVPLSGVPESFGSWDFHAGIDFFAFGDTTKAFNSGDGQKVTGLFGIGMSY